MLMFLNPEFRRFVTPRVPISTSSSESTKPARGALSCKLLRIFRVFKFLSPPITFMWLEVNGAGAIKLRDFSFGIWAKTWTKCTLGPRCERLQVHQGLQRSEV